MSTNGYKRMAFGAGALTAEDMNDLVSNMDILENNMVKGMFFVDGIQKDTGLTVQGLISGVVNPASNQMKYANIYWPKSFSPGCKPVISSSKYEVEPAPTMLSIRGIDGSLYPGNTGFRASLSLLKDDNFLWSSGSWSDKSTVYAFVGFGW